MEATKIVSQEEWDICLSVLERVKEDTSITPDLRLFQQKVSQTLKQITKEQKEAAAQKKAIEKKEKQKARKERDRTIIESTILAQQEPFDELNPKEQQTPLLLTMEKEPLKLHKPKKCYICNSLYHEVHHFYPSHCPTCAKRDYQKRTASTNIQGYRALVTGGRIKIGYETALKLLRDGAEVLVTTRFPQDAIKRYQQEPDFEMWRDRLTLYYLDLKHIPAVEAFTRYLLQTLPSLEILINNAAQTIRRPAEFYAHLEEGEKIPLPSELQALLGRWNNEYEQNGKVLQWTRNSQELIPQPYYFPTGKLDRDGQQIDLRPQNSWNTTLAEVDIVEMLEVQMVNVTAPFILNSRLKPLFLASPFEKKFIINVSAMEGQFNRKTKTHFHPHTNMGKASLNMLTRTAGVDYAKENIFMNSVDTGWVTQEHPYQIKKHLRKRGFVPPLDSIDGASRVYDPIIEGLKSEKPIFGKFIKDYEVSEW